MNLTTALSGLLSLGALAALAPTVALALLADDKSPAVAAPTWTTTASGLEIQELRTGDGAEAKAGRTVAVHYTGWLENGTKFDSSRDRGEPFAFRLGTGTVIRGWDEGVAGMHVGGQRKLRIPPELAYDARGAGGVIPPNATLLFEVELMGVR